MSLPKTLPKFDQELIRSRPAVTGLRDLFEAACQASDMDWGRLVSAMVRGCPKRLRPIRRYSEYNILNPLHTSSLLRFLSELTIPAAPHSTPDLARMLMLPAVNRLFWRPTGFFRQPDEYANVCSFPKEHWFFINGIATNSDVARYNSAYLAHLFHRPVTVVQNPTCSLPVDLAECMLGKGLRPCDRSIMTEPAWRATTAILEALNAAHTERVIVIAHSQGTIILSNVLAVIDAALNSDYALQEEPEWHDFTRELMGRVESEVQRVLRNGLAHALWEFTKDRSRLVMQRLKKLEIYTFANCADKMRYVHLTEAIPYMEHYANEFDWVARLGILSPLRDADDPAIRIDGHVFVQEGEWGHLLNEHYLAPIDDFKYPGPGHLRREDDPFPPSDGGVDSRLYGYFHGRSPEPLWVDP